MDFVAPKRSDPKTSETTARLIITQDGAQAWLEPISSRPDCDLILEGKGDDGRVYIAEEDGISPVLTVASLGSIEELATVLAGITIEGADPAAVAAIATRLQEILDTFGGKPNATIADLITYVSGVDDNLATTTTMAFMAQSSVTPLLMAMAGNPDPATITVGSGGITVMAVAAWNALVAQVDAGAVDEAAVNALIADALAGLNIDSAEPLAQQLIDIIGGKPQGGGTITDVAATFAALGQALMGAVGIEEAAVNALIQAALADLDLTGVGGGNVQPLLNLLAVKPNATLADVEAVWQALSDTSVGYVTLLSILSGKPISDNPTIADVQTGLPTLVGMIVQQALENLPDVGGLTPEQAAQLATNATNLQVLFNAVTGFDGANASMAGAALEAIREGLGVLDGTLNTTYDYLIRVINEINGEILIGDAAIDGVGPALDKLRAESAKAQSFFNAIYKHVAGWDGNGTPPTAQEAADNLASAIIDLQTNFDSLEEIVKNGQVLEAIQQSLGGGTLGGAADLTAVVARLDTLEAENTALKAEVATLKTGLQGLEAGTAEAIQQIYDVELPSIQETMAAIVEYVIETYAEKQAVDSLDATLSALMQALGGNDPAEVSTAFAAFSESVGLAIDQGFEDRLPGILEALSQHLETVLAIFTSGGQPGQIVTPAQLTQLLADIARDYATKTQLADYAKVNDPNQIITAKSTILQGIQFSNSGEVLIPVNDDYGNRLRLLPADLPNGEDLPCVIVHTDLLDLFPDAKEYATRADVEGLMAGKPGAMQPLLDAINGPDATLDSVQKMFWLLDDIIMALLEATGVEMPKDGK